MGRSIHPTTAAAPPTTHNPQLPNPDPQVLNRLLFPHNRHIRAKVFNLLKHPVFHLHHGETVQQERQRTLARLNHVRQSGLLHNTISLGSTAGVRRYDAAVQVLALLDHSLEILMGVNFGLFSATVRRLGSPHQRRHWLPRIERGLDFGCFALTELGHGSNVRAIETTATYHPATQHFLLHTPTDTAQKYWIGGAAQNATVAVVFAHLLIHSKPHGIHIFIVPLRSPDGNPLPGIRIADCGHKQGLNGVDNARICFTHVPVPRDNMLSAIAHVAPDGAYTSPYTTPDARFAAQLAALTGGRVGIATMAVNCAMLGLTIAVRYSMRRRAFRPPGAQAEVPLMFYSSQQRALMVPLATAFVYALCAGDLTEQYYHTIDAGGITKEVHTLSAGCKAMFSWFMNDALQAAREACGGQGYKSENRIAPMKADRDVMTTFEGANGVMLQQVAKMLLAEVSLASQNGGKFAKGSVAEALNNPPRGRGASTALDRDFLYSCLWHREKQLVQSLGRRYEDMMQRCDGSAFDAWNECLPLAEKTGIANMHRRIYEAHERHVENALSEDAGTGEALRLCGRLWGASVISSDPAFLMLGIITPTQAKDVDESLTALCRALTGIAEPLLEGIGFPDHLLAPITGDYVAHNSRAKL